MPHCNTRFGDEAMLTGLAGRQSRDTIDVVMEITYPQKPWGTAQALATSCQIAVQWE